MASLVSVAGGIINSVAGPLAAQQVNLLWTFKKEVRKLELTVSRINDVLEDAEAQQAKSSAVRNFLEELTEVLYEADDLLDVLSTEAQRREVKTQGKKAKKVRVFFLELKRFAHHLRMAHRIKDIRERLDEIRNNRNLHLLESHLDTRVTPIETDAKLWDAVIIGRKREVEEVIKLLKKNDDGNVLTVPIVGIGGLGKTALAKLIYNNKDFTKDFDLKMWVCVSYDFDSKIIGKKILECITEKQAPSALESIGNSLSKEINGKKYLLVLDDVWNDVDYYEWCSLKNLLGGGSKGSRVLVTTRFNSFTSVEENTILKPYKLRGLDEDKSWELFKQHAFKNEEDRDYASKEKIGKEVVTKCAGVPLALKSVGYMLNSKDLEHWRAFRETELSPLSLDDETHNIRSILKFSYNRLSSHLKQCFIYCSLFPKDYKYEKITLINLWIAQEFVKLQNNQCLEDTGHDYFMSLFYGSFFQEPEMDEFHNIVKCKMHDLMHDLAIEMRSSLFVTIGDNERKKNISEKTRFVGFHGNEDLSSIKQFPFKANIVRTFLCPMSFGFKGEIGCEFIFSNFKSLHVLDLSNRNLSHLPSSISKLKQLRYLDLSKNNLLQELPKSITRLVNLETLILFECELLEKLPRDFAKLINLRYLDLAMCKKLRYMPPRLGQLTNLKRLNCFVVCNDSKFKDCSSLNELTRLKNLRGKLEIKGFSDVRDIMVKVETMNLKQKFKENYLDSNLLTCTLSFTSLVSLKMDGHDKCQHVSSLSQLACLNSLKLHNIKGLESLRCFPKLRQLEIHDCPNLQRWWKGDSSMNDENDSQISEATYHSPSAFDLLKLDVCACPMLTTLPMCPNISVLRVSSCARLTTVWVGSNLDNLSVSSCPMLTNISMCPNDVSSVAPSVSTRSVWTNRCNCVPLTISMCPSLKNLVVSTGYLVTISMCPNLQNVNVSSDSMLQVEMCPNLKNLAVSSDSPSNIWMCPNIENLSVSSCSASNIWMCPNLGNLDVSSGSASSLWMCPHLGNLVVSSGSALTTYMCPNLENLSVSSDSASTTFMCPNLENLSVSSDSASTVSLGFASTVSTVPSDSASNLEKLVGCTPPGTSVPSSSNTENLVVSSGCALSMSPNLKKLVVSGAKLSVSPFPNLEKLVSSTYWVSVRTVRRPSYLRALLCAIGAGVAAVVHGDASCECSSFGPRERPDNENLIVSSDTVSSIRGCPNIGTLVVSSTTVSTISMCSNLQSLVVSKSTVLTVSSCPGLEYVVVSSGFVSTIWGCPKLRRLVVSSGTVSTISMCQNLESLVVSAGDVKTISMCQNLKSLVVSSGTVSTISMCQNLKNLVVSSGSVLSISRCPNLVNIVASSDSCVEIL